MAYSEFDLVTFGNYLLSKERSKSITYKPNKPYVHDCDLRNWKDKRKQEDIIVERMEQGVLSN